MKAKLMLNKAERGIKVRIRGVLWVFREITRGK